MNKKWWILLIAFLLGIAFFFLKNMYAFRYSPIVEKDAIIRIPPNGSINTIIDSLAISNAITDTATLREHFNKHSYNYRPGQFKITKGMSAFKLFRKLSIGEQKPSKMVFTNGRLLGNFTQQATRFIHCDSASLHQALLDSIWLKENNLKPHTVISIAIPNTYHVYWSSSPEDIRKRLLKEHKAFWNKNNRLDKAKELKLNPEQVYTLASIVESETNYKPERPKIAGVYLNRIQKGINLEADPTVVFAMGDFSINRVLYKHLEYDSPYNTYKYPGLPPGPISMASISSIDAVLNHEKHNLLFFVAKGDASGAHNFAKDMRGHSKNIGIFQRNLRKRGRR